MKMTPGEYNEYVKKNSPPSPMGTNILKAYLVGGLICCVGQVISDGFTAVGLASENAALATSLCLVLIGVLLTGLRIYDKIAKFAGAGTLVPITGFANSVASPAIEFRAEGLVTGLGAKMFTVAGPVIVYGLSASVVYGFIYWLITGI